VSEQELAAIEKMVGKLALRFGTDEETLVVPVLLAEVRRLRASVKAMRDDVQAVFQNHHCLVCANGSPCKTLMVLSRILSRAAEAEVDDPQPSPVEPTATDVLFPGVQP
jgi:hypothetical protein